MAMEVARRLLTHEVGEGQDPEDLAKAAESACQKLYRQLAKLIGSAGFQALLLRAVSLAKAEFLFLKRVESEPEAGTCLKGLLESVQGRDPGVVKDSLIAMFANFISLLVTFIGEDLALRLVRKTWPEVPFDDMGSGSEEAKK